ncbi:MAG: M56 family metallopeptidase [Acidobacteriota bacterium]
MSLTEVASVLAVYSLQVGLLLALTLPLPRLLGLKNPGLRLAFYHLLLGIVLVLPAAGLLPVSRPASGLAIDLQIGSIIADSAAHAQASLFVPILIFGAASIAAFRLIRIGCGLLALGYVARQATSIRLEPALGRRLACRMRQGVRIRSTGRIKSPAAFGCWRPVILVPREFVELTEAEQEAIIFHELLHLQRRDWPVSLLEQIVRAFLWFHPLVLLLIDRIELAREQVVDREVIRVTRRRRAYLETLQRAAEAFRQASVVPTIPFVRASHLRHRVDLLTQEVCMTRSRQFVTGLTLVSSALLLSVVSVAAFPSQSLQRASWTAHPASLLALSGSGPSADARSEGEARPQEVNQSDPVDLSEDPATQPKLIKQVSPVYPEEAKKEGVTGQVISKVQVNEQGKVVEVNVEQSPDERLSRAAVEALRQWEWEPLLKDGKAVSFVTSITINFALR